MNAYPSLEGDSAETRMQRAPRALEAFQQIRVFPPQKSGRRRLRLLPFFALIFVIFLAYFLAPLRTNILVLGVDAGLGRGDLGRSDTIVLATISPLQPYVGLLSIPRDLWVNIPGVGENRINTAYFFAEGRQEGSGPRAAAEAVTYNFRVPVNHTVVVRMDGLVDVIDALGGVEVTLEKSLSGYAPGVYHFDGQQALAFVRSRAGSDDFSRMFQGQALLKASLRCMLQPDRWARLPQIWQALDAAVDLDVPVWQWPRLVLALLRAGPDGIETHAISREMVNPFVTPQGAQVLAPRWEKIDPVVDEIFRALK